MSYEVILPMPMTMESVVDQMAHAAWRVLASSNLSPAIYPGYFIPLRQAVEEQLMHMLLEEEDLGSAKGYRFIGGRRAGERLEDGIARAVLARLPGVLGDIRVADAFLQTVPSAMHSVLEPFIWFEGGDVLNAVPDQVMDVPDPRAGSRTTGDSSKTAGAT